MNRRVPAVAVAGGLIGFAAAAYPAFGRDRCLHWGARPDEVAREMPGDDLLPDAPTVSTRAVSIDAPPSAIWPWLLQMGPGRGGLYTHPWIEKLLGPNMHSANGIVPGLRTLAADEELPLAGKLRMRVEQLDAERALVMRSHGGAWVWSLGLHPDNGGRTRLVSRHRIQNPSPGLLADAVSTYLLEPGSLLLEHGMLLGIKARAERLHGSGDRRSQPVPGCHALSPTRVVEAMARITEP